MSEWNNVFSRRLTDRAEEVRKTNGCCAGLVAPCKVDCLCWLDAADDEASRLMNMSDKEIRAEIVAGGEDPDEVATRVRRVIASAIAAHTERAP